MNLTEALQLLDNNNIIVESSGNIIRYHITKQNLVKGILKYGLDPNSASAGHNTADAKRAKPGVWLAGSRDFIPVMRGMPDDDKVLLKITMPYEFYISKEREYWPNGRTRERVIAKPFEPPMNSREGRSYVEKINASIPPEYITVESDIGLNHKGDKAKAEYYRYILEEIKPDYDVDEMTDKEVEYYLRTMPIDIRSKSDIVDGITITRWKLGELPVFTIDE